LTAHQHDRGLPEHRGPRFRFGFQIGQARPESPLTATLLRADSRTHRATRAVSDLIESDWAKHDGLTVIFRTCNRAALLTYAALLTLTAAAWVWMLRSPMGGDDMAGMQMLMAPTARDAVAYVVAWAVMMAAMMLPSAMPMIALYAATQRNTATTAARAAAVGGFALMYLALWAATGLPIYFASLALMALAPSTLAYVTAGVLVTAGIFQLSPLKQVCLRHCRSPLGFLVGHWRAGWRGGLALGLAHACYCLGCCWALMVVLVVAGAMGLPWVLVIACVVAAEKLVRGGEWIARAAGVALTLLGLATALHPGLATALRTSWM
jgi:predicted metal-binding membrane protein